MFRRDRWLALIVLVIAALGAPSVALAGERTLLLRTTEDPSVPNTPPGCPFTVPNLRLGATVWSHVTRADTGEVVKDQVHQVGTASACGLITAPLVPSTTPQFYIEFTLGSDVFAARGTCTVISNDVPVTGLILAGCTLRLVSFPSEVLGGVATSMSVFNPLQLQGFSTGSFWTLRLYTAD
jgi:hypothetical protein